MTYLLAHTSDSMDEKAVRKLIKKGAKAKSDEIIEAIKGYNIETDQAKKLELARGPLDYPDVMITQTEVELYVRIKPYYEFVEYVSTLLGMTYENGTRKIPLDILAEYYGCSTDSLIPLLKLHIKNTSSSKSFLK